MIEKEHTQNQRLGLLGLLFGVFYIAAELTFNLGLIDFLNSPNTEIDTFHTLETFGRILSSIGFACFLTSICFIFYKKSVYRQIFTSCVFVLSMLISYGAQTAIFNKIINDMTPEQKLSAYAFGVYRNLNLNNQVNLKILNGENSSYDLVINSMLGVFTTVPTVEASIKSTVQSFFHAENNIDQNMLGKIYDEIQSSVPNFDDYWGIYVIESRRYENFQGFKELYRKKFIEKVGIPPSLSRPEFEQHLKKQSAAFDKFENIVIIPSNDQINMRELKLNDIPEDLNRMQWIEYINNYIDQAIDNVKFDEKNIEVLPHSEKIVSSVVITPIAIVLSMLALFLNVIMLVAKWSKFFSLLILTALVAVAGVWNYNPYNINAVVNKLAGLETYLVQFTKPYMKVIHAIAINDDNPNPYQIVRIEKPTMPNMGKIKQDMDAKFKDLSSVNNGSSETASSGVLDSMAQSIKVDQNKINNENYYGELKKENPYLK